AQEYPALTLGFNQARQLALAGHAYVEVTIGGQDHTIHTVVDEALSCDPVRLANAAAPVGGAARLESSDGLEDSRFVAARGWWQHQAHLVRVDHQRDTILFAQLLDEQGERALDQRQLVRVVHRARDVDQEYEVPRRRLRVVDAARAQPDVGQKVAGRP